MTDGTDKEVINKCPTYDEYNKVNTTDWPLEKKENIAIDYIPLID